MGNLKITEVPQAQSVAANNDFYVKVDNNFRRVPISALLTLIESEVDFTPEPGFNQKCLAMKLQNGIYVIDEANSDFDGSDYMTFAQFAAAIYYAHRDGYEVFCRIFDGQYENAVPYLGNLGGAMLKFGGWELSADGLQPVVYTYTEAYGFVREVIDMGSGGGGGSGVSETFVRAAVQSIYNLFQKAVLVQSADTEALFGDLEQFLPTDIRLDGDVLKISGGVNVSQSGDTLTIS